VSGDDRPRLGRRYWRLWTAGTVSNFGDGVDAAALPLLAATLTRDPRLVAGLAVAFSLPWLLFALPAGALVDRLDRRRVMWHANAVRALLVALIAVLAATGIGGIAALYAVALALGVCETLFDNAAQAMLPAIVPASLLATANGRQYAAEVVANQFAGPPLGGVLFAASVSLPFWLDSATFAVSAVLIATLRGSFRPATSASPSPARRSLRAEIAEGLRWLRGHRLLRTLALLLGVSNLATSMGFATFVLLAQDELGVSARGFGVLLAGMAVGSVVGGLVGGRFAARLGPARSLVAAAGIMGVLHVAVGLAGSALFVAVLLAIVGVFTMVWNIVTVSLRQQIVPDHLLGRVNSAYRFLGWGSIPLGALLGGLVANTFGLRVPWVAGGLVALAGLVVCLPVLTQRTIDASRAAVPARAG
jgi:MFS family permease